MSSGVSNIRSKGNLLNCYEFEWDPSKGSQVYIIVSDSSSHSNVYYNNSLFINGLHKVVFNWQLLDYSASLKT